MSLDKYMKDEPEIQDKLARCRKAALKSYMGTLRRSEHPDESGAEWVIVLLFGGERLLFATDPARKEFYIITKLPEFHKAES